jgi:hypothetical protein
MPPTVNPVIEQLRAEIARDVEVESSAAVLIRGFGTRMQAAVDAALENGATAAQLEPVTTELTTLVGATDDLAAAVAEGTAPTP